MMEISAVMMGKATKAVNTKTRVVTVWAETEVNGSKQGVNHNQMEINASADRGRSGLRILKQS